MASETKIYNAKQLGTVEVATLVKDIPLPSYDKVLTASMVQKMVLQGVGSFTPITTAYSSVKADFYINIEIPNLSKEDKIDELKAAPQILHGGNRLNTSSYRTTNTIRLEIPKYLVMMFDGKIPKGTKFLVTSLADKADAKNIRIISLYNASPDQLISDELLDAQPSILGGGR